MIIESALAVGFRSPTTRTGCAASHSTANPKLWWPLDDTTTTCLHFAPRRNESKGRTLGSKARALAKGSSSASDHSGANGKQSYHPFEEIHKLNSEENVEHRLSPAESARTLIEVNSKGTLMFSGLINDQVHENIFWPDLAYLTDEHGNIYFEVNDAEDILRILTTDNNFVQVIIGMDTTEMLNEMELGQGDIDFGFEEIVEEDSDGDDEDVEDEDDDNNGDYDDDWVGALEDEEDELDSDETLGDWAKLETMRSSHPMYFAKKLVEVSAGKPLDWMDQPSAGLVIQGLLRPAFIDERSVIRRHVADHDFSYNTNKVGKMVEDKLEDLRINGLGSKSDLKSSSKDGSIWPEEMEKDKSLTTGSSFYKLEMIKIQIVSPQGNQIAVEVKDFQRAQPDAIAHSAGKIISRLKAGGEKTTEALKSLCLRVKGIQVEEVAPSDVDSLGLELRVCSGTQIQTLRFGFHTQAFSEYSAERQLHELLFPGVHQKQQKKQEAHQKE